MCGILAIVGRRFPREALERASAVLAHRGPDGAGQFVSDTGDVGLAHRRLAIIDLEGGAQPISTGDGQITLVFNGEIYDFERLRAELSARGHRLRTRCDAEVVVHLYAEHGIGFLSHLRGEFAFVLHDARARRVLVVRDRFGIKPMFHAMIPGGGHVFSSEVKGIFATGLHAPAFHLPALRSMAADMKAYPTVFAGIDAVPPGCVVELELATGEARTVRYWDPARFVPAEGDARSLDEHAAALREEIDAAVRLRMRADVPVGVLLSGGIDSSYVAATAARHASGRLSAFSVAFSDDDAFDEGAIARRMAEHLGAEHHTVRVGADDLLENLEQAMWHAETPQRNYHGVAKLLVARLASRHVKVVLTGEGSDEIFFGYDLFRRLRADADAESVAARMDGQVRSLDGLFHPRHRGALAAAREPPFFGEDDGDERPLLLRAQLAVIRNLLGRYILPILGDHQEMGASIEGRPPFLDHHLCEMALRIPVHHRLGEGRDKLILRHIARDRVLPEIVDGRKWPFMAPPVRLRPGAGPAADRLIDEYLSRRAVEAASIFDFAEIERLLAAEPGREDATEVDCRLQYALSVQILHKHFIGSLA